MIIAIDQSTSATKAMLWNEECHLVYRANVPHQQYYPQAGWVEHDAEEIYDNVVKAIGQLPLEPDRIDYSLAITNQRETVVVWNRLTGKPIHHAVVWQCMRGAEFCNELKAKGFSEMVQEKSGLLIDPYFAASGAKWLLDNVPGAREAADRGELLMGTIDSWLVWKLTGGKVHATDLTNASRTLLMNIHTLQWDDDLLQLFTIPRTMMPEIRPCDAVYGETTVEGLFKTSISIVGVLGDSHGALTGQMCFEEGLGKKWLEEQLQMIQSPADVEPAALNVPDNGGVYFVPAFAGLGAPWWNDQVKAAVFGMSLATTRNHFLRAALESIAYQVNDLVQAMVHQAGITLKELRVDGGPTKNNFLMQFQADCLRVPINCSDVEEASAMGAVIMNGLGRGLWKDFDEVATLRRSRWTRQPQDNEAQMDQWIAGWQKAVKQLLA